MPEQELPRRVSRIAWPDGMREAAAFTTDFRAMPWR